MFNIPSKPTKASCSSCKAQFMTSDMVFELRQWYDEPQLYCPTKDCRGTGWGLWIHAPVIPKKRKTVNGHKVYPCKIIKVKNDKIL